MQLARYNRMHEKVLKYQKQYKKSWLTNDACERCLLITESPKTPGRYRYLIWVLVNIPYAGRRTDF